MHRSTPESILISCYRRVSKE